MKLHLAYVLPGIVRLKCNMIFDTEECHLTAIIILRLDIINVGILELLLLLQKNKTFEKKYFR